ncbi:MAG: hypothetical protein IPP46_07765 [Bacteroidetes bacterium]|nr:hypothetical protein [Bacteroidota bacterium]
MKKFYLSYLCFHALILHEHSCRGISVYIPDPVFRAYLNQYYSSCMVGDSIDPLCPAVLGTKHINVVVKNF